MSTLAGYCVNHHNVSMSKLRNPNQQDLVLVVGHCRVLPRHRDVVLQAGEAAEQVHGSLVKLSTNTVCSYGSKVETGTGLELGN